MFLTNRDLKELRAEHYSMRCKQCNFWIPLAFYYEKAVLDDIISDHEGHEGFYLSGYYDRREKPAHD
jgi:hypothetical protein